ncbi:MAG: hypothetical protein NVSMB25_03380 [Thermoleophilaceae bacterium]
MTAEAPTFPERGENAHPSQMAEPVDYAKLNVVYGSLVVGVVLATRERAGRAEPILGRELLPIAAATFALSKVVAREKIGTWVREPFVEQDAEGGHPRGSGLRRAIGELVTCTRCVGAWSALGIVGLRLADPPSGRIVTNVLAASAANDWLQAGFRLLTARANRTDAS